MSINNPNQVHIGRDAINVTEGNQYNYAYNVNLDGEAPHKLSGAEALRTLAQNAAPNACYDSEQRFPPPNCHEGTRLQILEKLSSRIEDRSKADRVLWVHGSAGVGKSAIAQHLAEKYARSGRLGAAFFFSRNDSTRDKIRPLAASIAYQFCKAGSPFRTTLGPAIIDTIRSDPNIFHTSCENQVQQLLVELSSNMHTAATKEQGFAPYLIVIDGLDECIDRAEQERVLAIVQVLISHSAPYFSWIVLLCSRPEPQIRHGFDHYSFIGHLEAFDVNSLDNINHDIHRYLVDKFATLQMKYRYALEQERPTWPGEDVLEQLVSRADGQFIFAATVIKYIDVDYEPPQDRLDIILRIYVEQGESPYSPLDMLYHQILSSCHKWDKVKSLLRLLRTPHTAPPDEHRSRANHPDRLNSEPTQWRSSEMLALLLNLKVHEISTLLIRLHSVLQIPEGINREQNILFAHATFPEFLADPNRSGPFYTPAMSESEYCDCVATLLLRTLAALTPSYPLYNLESFDRAKHSWFLKFKAVNWLVAFSCHWWNYYCLKVISPSVNLLGELEALDIHVVVAISSALDLFVSWEGVINWAKGLGSMMNILVKKLETTIKEVHITFGTSLDDYWARRRTFRGILSTEQWLLGPRDGGIPLGYSSARTFEDMILEELRTPSELSSCESWPSFDSSDVGRIWSSSLRDILIVPRNIIPKVSHILFVVRVTRDNVRIFQRIYDALKRSDSWSSMIRLLLAYVMNRTLTISDHSGNPVRFPKDILEGDLVCFAAFFKERLAALNLDLKWSEGSFWLVDTARQGNACDTRGDAGLHSSEEPSRLKGDTKQCAPHCPLHTFDADDRSKGDRNQRRDYCCFQ